MNKLGSFTQDRKKYTDNQGALQWQEPSFYAVLIYRFGQWAKDINNVPMRKFFLFFYRMAHAFISVLTGIYLPLSAQIGPGLRIWHFGCIILHPNSIIGQNCEIRHEVTIGNRRNIDDVPIIGDNVSIGAGAKILGNIRIGNNAIIGANAVVLQDVPDNHIAVGNPARILNRKEKSNY